MAQFSDLTKESFSQLSNQVALIDFWASWCGPCKVMEPILEEKVAPQFPGVNFYKVNTDQQQELAIQFGIRSIPNMLLIQFNGQGEPNILHSFVGVQDAFEMTMKMNEILSTADGAESVDELAQKRDQKNNADDKQATA